MWTLTVIDHDGERSFPGLKSGDAAKSRAREHKKWSGDSGVTFRITDPQGQPWQHTEADGSWRLCWHWSQPKKS